MSQPTLCNCQKEAEIAELQTQVKILNNIVMGNGQPGLAQTVPVLNRNVSELNKTIGSLTTGVSGLLKFQEQEMGKSKGKTEIRKRNRWIIGILITLASGLLGTIIYLMDMILDHLQAVPF